DRVADGLFAVAETGSVAVALPRDERGEALLADRLWLVVPASEIAATLDDALARIEALVRAGSPYVTLMTGPSRTADIERALTVGGGVVHEAATADDARETVLRLLRERGVTLFAKGKSMVAEEVFLNHHLEAAGIRVVETDLGEWIIQLAHETPSHMVMPAIHKSRQQIAGLIEQAAGRAVPREDVQAQVAAARHELRRAFLDAEAGLIGANALIVETG